jgi:membrane protein DedA with SNARE-associated domain
MEFPARGAQSASRGHATGTYWAIFGVVLSTLVVPLPEELALLGAGYLAHQGAASLAGAYLSALAGVLLGDTVTFLLGRGLLPKFLGSHWGRKVVSASLRRWAEELVREHPMRAILLARFLVGLRGPVYLAIGAARPPAWKFIAMNSAVGMVEVGIIVGLGYEFGASHELAKDLRWLEITIGITLALLLVVLPLLLKRFLEKRQPA